VLSELQLLRSLPGEPLDPINWTDSQPRRNPQTVDHLDPVSPHIAQGGCTFAKKPGSPANSPYVAEGPVRHHPKSPKREFWTLKKMPMRTNSIHR